jgi:hypothetical protein
MMVARPPTLPLNRAKGLLIVHICPGTTSLVTPVAIMMLGHSAAFICDASHTVPELSSLLFGISSFTMLIGRAVLSCGVTNLALINI